MNYKELINSIKQNQIKNIYLFSGDEGYLIDDALERLKTKLVQPSFEQLNFSILDGKEVSLGKIIDALETLPFMAEKKLVYARGFDVFSGKSKTFSEEEEKRLIEYISEVPDSTIIVFYDIQTIDSRKKIIKEIKKYGEIVDFSKLNEEDFSRWIKKILKKNGKEIGNRELVLLRNGFDYLGRNASKSLFDVENELKKIVAFMGTEVEVKEEYIQKTISSNFQNDIFKLLDSIERRNTSDSIKRLNYILDDGEHVLKILTTLGNQLKNILHAKLLLGEGYTSKMIATKLNIHPFVASKCLAQSKQFTEDRLRLLLNSSLNVDLSIKTGKMSEQLALEMLVIEMCK